MAFDNTFTAPWQFLTKYIEQLKDEPFFLKGVLGKQKIMSPTTSVKWRLISKGNELAGMGYRDDPAKSVDLGVTSTEYTATPPQIFEKDYIESSTPLLQSFDPRQLANLDTASDIYSSLQYIYGAKLQGLKDRVNRRIEWMFAELLKSGSFSYNDGVRAISQDYSIGDATAMTISSSTNPLDLMEGYAGTFAQNLGVFPNLCIMSANVARAFIDHSKVEKFISKNTFQFGNLKPSYASPSVKFLGAFPEFAIPEIYVYAGNYTNSSGVVTNYIGDDYLILTNTNYWNLAYGAVIDYEIEPSGRPIMSEILVKERIPEENEGHIKTVSALSFPLPVLLHTSAVSVYDVTIE